MQVEGEYMADMGCDVGRGEKKREESNVRSKKETEEYYREVSFRSKVSQKSV